MKNDWMEYLFYIYEYKEFFSVYSKGIFFVVDSTLS